MKKSTMKFAGLFLALVMVISMTAVFASADGYTITVNNAVSGEAYSAYKILDIESYTSTSSATVQDVSNQTLETATYKINAAWVAFFAPAQTEPTEVPAGPGLTYFNVDEDGYVSAKSDSIDVAALAKDALAFATAKGIDPIKTETASGTSVTIAIPGEGYYLVDSTVGTLCMITNTDPNAIIDDKNEEPTLEKTANKTSASVGELVTYTATITAQPGAENYVYHDIMDTTLDLNTDSITVTGLTVNDDYTVDFDPEDDDTFEIVFDQDYLDTITTETTITITYTAYVNADSLGSASLDNDGILNYGDKSKTTTSTASVKNFGFDLAKYDGDTKEVIDGAIFNLYTAETGGTALTFVVDETTGAYRPLENGESATASADIPANIAKIDGLAAGTYYLEEAQQPNGYNKISGRKAITIGGDTGDVFFTANAPAAVGASIEATTGGVLIENNQGSVLPETGGEGTTVYYMIGTLIVLVAAVLFVSKKRLVAAK